MIRGTLFLLGIIGAAIFAIDGHFDRGGAESRLGPEASVKVERLAKAAVRDFYATGSVGEATCVALDGIDSAPAPNADSEKVWNYALDDAYYDHPDHKRRSSLGEHPSLQEIYDGCEG